MDRERPGKGDKLNMPTTKDLDQINTFKFRESFRIWLIRDTAYNLYFKVWKVALVGEFLLQLHYELLQE